MLDGRQLRVALDHVLIPGGVKTVVGEGMPISKQPGSKGVLRISWDIGAHHRRASFVAELVPAELQPGESCPA